MLNTEPARRIAIKSPSNRSRAVPEVPFPLTRRHRLTHHSRSSAVTRPVPQAMITCSISSPTGASNIPFKRSASLASFSPADNAQGLPITFANENGYFTSKPIFSHIPAKIEVTGTPTILHVLYHSPAVAISGKIQRRNPLLFPILSFFRRRRDNSPAAPRPVENTRAVGLKSSVTR